MENEEYIISTRLPNGEIYALRYESGDEVEVLEEIKDEFYNGKLGLKLEDCAALLAFQIGINKARRLRENLLSAQ